ncbi:DUF4291 domain-containing protein [Hazenella sp. IB182353]|uniref:DUF4291 family protein n=1 Tax=Polycladospora coralii TaxID=2771432 RepID=UPI0017474823|nr:DUF4291 domain-containing protein [Polycladospora coralii]
MKLVTEPYREQVRSWPQKGRHILAQFDQDTIVVYQAYHPGIGQYAEKHNRFGEGFKLTRMSWIKTNFLWMMYRSGWGTKENQEMILAIWLKRDAFESILANAVNSSYDPDQYASYEEWKQAGMKSDVRLQWDPDHDPLGNKVERRAIQLGLRGDTLMKYSDEWIVQIEDISDFVAMQRSHAQKHEFDKLVVPKERPYLLHDPALKLKLGIG